MEHTTLEKFKTEVHRTLISKLDLEKLSRVNSSQARQAVAAMVTEIISDQRVPLNYAEQEKIQSDLLDEVFGLGPLEPLLRDPKISDILVNGKDRVFIERGGRLTRTEASFRDDRHLLQVIDRIVSRVGRRVDESSPMVDARLPDGSRVNAIIPPLALDGPALSIRRFGTGPVGANQLVELKSISAEMLELMAGAVRARISVLISGGTGAGKTTFLNILSQYIPQTERIVTIEDAAELQLAQQNIVRLETRPPNIEGVGAIRQRQLLVNSLRMRPDRIILGEVRGEEAFDMLQAMNTGHEGSMATIHANTPRDAISRLESMVAMTSMNLPEKSVRQQIASAVSVIVQVSRMSDGTRKVVSISEITGMEENVITMHEIFAFKKKGIGPDGRVLGVFQPTQIRPKFLEKLRVAGIIFPQSMFERVLEVN
ncbi:CpaF family protein [Alloacidobacterium dinghuense]|uniref:CpaF family protein n=1 Tax=Alloacidobacterium dinghuense TaxID=2763107 RepID=A0A7G8BK10_9BACT|nr:CpaF family protein [Alloacidobacterium dinghuense]QNI32880.1 CpaF family protein [Alloacidobacterium dinghuense]